MAAHNAVATAHNPETAGHNPVAIANYFIQKKCPNMTMMKVLKLSYIAHGFSLGLDNGPLSNEPAEAWKWGPVFTSIYFNGFGGQNPYNIKEPAKEDDTGKIITSNFTDADNKTLKLVYDIYGRIKAWRLSALTHKEGTPWHKTVQENGCSPSCGAEIDDDDIKKHFHPIVLKYKINEIIEGAFDEQKRYCQTNSA